jgi:nucleoside-diphosphate-sugar epimerase/MoaA/NifB/PqqE/SkfB family radical SAM enzyme/broad specificity phosphatase PhoE/LmbE family N-acetylglucosaminyl deacetylase
MKPFRKITSGPSLSLKTIASFIVLTFVATQVLVPTPTSFAQTFDPKIPGGDPVSVSTAQVLNGKIAVPLELGKIEESFQGTTNKTIFFIQDAHDSLEAQENIAKLIGKFVKEKGIKTVFEEGYEGPVPTDKFFGFIKDPKIKQKVSYFLLDKLRLGGAEYAHINRANDFKLIGVEDLKLYSENIKCYQKSSASRKDIEADLGELVSQITALANQYFPKDLRAWLKWKELFSEGKLPLLNYLNELQAFHLKDRSAKQFVKEYPAISILLMAQTARDPEMIKQLNALDSKVVFEEILQLEQDISSTFLQNERDRDIFAYFQGLNLLKKLNQIELTQAEYEATKEVLQKLETQKLVDFIVSLTHRSLVLSKEWEQHIQDAIRFYGVAHGRDQSIDSHLNGFFQSKEDAAILVFGGFHANGIKEILKQQGLSYLIISPKITSTDKRHQDYYQQLMSVGHHSFEVPFLAARANKPPGSLYLAATGQEAFVRTELRAIASSVEAGNTDPQLIERGLAAFIHGSELTSGSKTSPSKKRAEARTLTTTESEAITPKFQTAQEFFGQWDDWKMKNPKWKIAVMVRHGWSGTNQFRYVNASDIFSPLTLLGHIQRFFLKCFFEKNHVRFDRYVSSPLERAYATIASLAAQWDVKLETSVVFGEIDTDLFGGVPENLIRAERSRLIELFFDDPSKYQSPRYSGSQRVKAIEQFFAQIEQGDERTTLIASHSYPILMALASALNIPYSKFSLLRNQMGFSPNAGITVLGFNPDTHRWDLLVSGDSSYLPKIFRKASAKKIVKLIERIFFYGQFLWRQLLILFGRTGSLPISDYKPSSKLLRNLTASEIQDRFDQVVRQNRVAQSYWHETSWVVRESSSRKEKGFIYQVPRLANAPRNPDQAWSDFYEMVFEFPKLLEEAARKKLPVVLIAPENLSGHRPLADEAPWVEGARTALAWASAYYRAQYLGNVDVRVLQIPDGVVDMGQIREAAQKLFEYQISDNVGTPEDRMAGRLFPLDTILRKSNFQSSNYLLEPRTISETLEAGEQKRPPAIIYPDFPEIPKGKQRIVITGAAGLIGVATIQRLLKEGHQIIALDNLSRGTGEYLSQFQGNPNFYFQVLDVSYPFDVRGPVGRVIHLASLASPPDNFNRPLETLQSGLQGTLESMELARRKHARFLFTSSSEIYGNSEVHPQPETYAGNADFYQKRSQYVQSKRGAETLMKLYMEKYRNEGVDLRIARIFNVYGPHMKITDGRVVTNFIKQVLENMPLEIYGSNSITRSFNYVDDAVEGLLKLLETDRLTAETPIEGRVFNIGNPAEITLCGLAMMINSLGRQYLGWAVPVKIVKPLDPHDPVKRQPDITRARAILGYEPKTQLPQGLENTFKYFLKGRKRSEMRTSGNEQFPRPDLLLQSTESRKYGAGSLRKDVSIDATKGEAQLHKLEIPLTVAFFVETAQSVQRLFDYLNVARQTLPPNVKMGRILIGTPLGKVREKILALGNELETFGLEFEVLQSEESNYSDLMYRFEGEALSRGTRAVAVLNGAIDYPPEHLVTGLRSLLSVNAPSVITSHLDKVEDVLEAQNKPVDFMFFTDPDFVKYRQKGKSWLDSVRPYLVTSSSVDKNYRVHSGIGDIDQVSIGGHAEQWKVNHFDQFHLSPSHDLVVESNPGDTDAVLPKNESVLFFEPHQDDYALRASGLLQRLNKRNNQLRFVHFETTEGTEDSYYWPPFLEYRDRENREAFARLGVKVNYRPITVSPSVKGHLDQEVELFRRQIEANQVGVLVIPGSDDTHRHHARIRYIALAAAQQYSDQTGRSLKIISIPLYSSPPQGFQQANNVIRLSPQEDLGRQRALQAYASQGQYVRGDLFDSRQAEMQEVLQRVTGRGGNPGGAYLEGFQEQWLIPATVLQRGDLAIQIARNESLTVSFREGNRRFAFFFKRGEEKPRFMIDDQEVHAITVDDLVTLNHFTAAFLSLVSDMDPERGHSSVREIETPSGQMDTIDWMLGLNALDTSGVNKYDLAAAYRESYERIIGKIEDVKMAQIWFRRGARQFADRTLPQDQALYQERIKTPKKLVIGIATYNSAELIASRLENIRQQIMELPSYCHSWQIEVVLYSNAKPEDVDAMTDAMIAQIPKKFFDGLPVRSTIVVRKEPFPSQANSLHRIYEYAKQNHADMVLFSDDDVDYEPGAIRAMIDRLLHSEGPKLVSGRFYWRARPIEVLRKEAETELSQKPIFLHLPGRIQNLIIQALIFYKNQWQEIARFRRRPDISFSPRVAMGAGLLMWTDHYAGFPYWFPQADVIQRYRYFPFIEVVDDAKMSSVAARSFSYLVKKAPRTLFGWRNQINKIFSKDRRKIQRDGDVFYARDIHLSDWLRLSIADQFYTIANLSLIFFARCLSKMIPMRRSKAPNVDERGADTLVINLEETFMSTIRQSITPDWDEFRLNRDQITVIRNNEGIRVLPVLTHPIGLKEQLLDLFERTAVDPLGWPIVEPQTLNSLAEVYLNELKNARNIDVWNLLRVFIVLYSVPDVRAETLMNRLQLNGDELLVLYDEIRGNEIFQDLISSHPTNRHYFSRLRGLVQTREHTISILNHGANFPLDAEIHPSATCNLQCKFCYNRNGLFYEEQLRGEKVLTPDEWRSLVREMGKKGLRRIDLVGGLEPFRNKEGSLAIIDEARQQGIRLRIFTNGYALRPDQNDIIQRLLYANVERLDISVRGGTGETHLRIVGGRDPNDFVRLKENIAHIIQERNRTGSHMKISVNFVLVPDNFRELPEMFQLVDELGADVIGLGTNNIAGRDQLDLSQSEQEELAGLLKAETEKMAKGERRRFDIGTNESIDRMMAKFERYGFLPAIYHYTFGLPAVCSNFFIRPIINPFGNVFKCCVVGQPMIALPIGYMGQIVKSGKSLEEMVRLTATHLFRDCPTCNPAERTGLAVIEKLAADLRAGIPLDRQPIRSEMRTSRSDKRLAYYAQKGKEISEFAAKTGGRLPVPTFDVDRMITREDVDLDLPKLTAEERGRYWGLSIEYLRRLQSAGGKIGILILMGGASSRMRQGPLPPILINAMQQDPERFVDPSKFTDEEQRIIREKYQGDFSMFVKSLDPKLPSDLSVLDHILYASKAFLPAGSLAEDRWHSLDEYGLRNVSVANEELERLGLGRPFVAIVGTSDEYYQLCLDRFAKHDFYGLKVATKTDETGRIDVDYDDLSNELLVYTDTPGLRIVAPFSVVGQNATNSGLFPTEATYEYARQFSLAHGGEPIADRAFVGEGAEFLAMLGVSKTGRKRPLMEELVRRRIEYGFGRTADNMAMLNEDWLVILGHMLDKQLSLVFETSNKPKGETGSFFAWVRKQGGEGSGKLVRRLLSFDAMRASLDPRIDIENLLQNVPINNGAWYFRFPTPANVDTYRDIFSANMSPDLRRRFSDLIKRIPATNRMDVTPADFETFQYDLRERSFQTPVLKTIRDPFLLNADDDQRILTVVMEYAEQSEQNGLLNKTGIVLAPSVYDAETFSPRDYPRVRFDPIKRRSAYANPLAQNVREALLRRVISGPLFSDDFRSFVLRSEMRDEAGKAESAAVPSLPAKAEAQNDKRTVQLNESMKKVYDAIFDKALAAEDFDLDKLTIKPEPEDKGTVTVEFVLREQNPAEYQALLGNVLSVRSTIEEAIGPVNKGKIFWSADEYLHHVVFKPLNRLAPAAEVPRELIEKGSQEKVRVAAASVPAFRVRWQGITMGADGAMVLQGFVEDTALLDLRENLSQAFPDGKPPAIIHVTLGRFNSPVGKKAYRSLLGAVTDLRSRDFGSMTFKHADHFSVALKKGQRMGQESKQVLASVDLRQDKVASISGQDHTTRAELRMGIVSSVGIQLGSSPQSIVRAVQRNAQPATVFVDAGDWGNLSEAQKREYFFVALSRAEARIVVYNERGQVQDKALAALLKLERVQRTERSLDQAISVFARPNVPAIHLSKQVLPSQTSVGSLRKRVAFFKTHSDKSGTLATALLWAISGGEGVRMLGVRQEDGFWTVEESLLDSLQRIYDNNFVIAVAA